MAYFKRHFMRGGATALAAGWSSDAVDWHHEEVWVTLEGVTVLVYPNLEPAACKLALMHRTRTRHWSRSFLKKWRRRVRRELRHRRTFWALWSASNRGLLARDRRRIRKNQEWAKIIFDALDEATRKGESAGMVKQLQGQLAALRMPDRLLPEIERHYALHIAHLQRRKQGTPHKVRHRH